MTLKRFSPNSACAMFARSAKKVCFVPIIAFVLLFLNSVSSIMYPIHDSDRFGYFWNELSGNFSSVTFGFLFGFAGVLTGVIIFNFVLSKKQCNVVFSLGLSRRKIFLSNYLAGIIPFYTAIILAAFLELLGVFCSGYAINAPIIEIALYTVFSIISVYTLAYTMTAVAFAFSGNIIEALVFSLTFAIFPNGMGTFFLTMRNMFTHGGDGLYTGEWNLFNPLFFFTDFLYDESYVTPSISNYFLKNIDGTLTYRLTIYDFSGIISGLVLAAIIFALGFAFFPKRKNEISGTFGRAKGLNEICGVLVGFYVMSNVISTYNNGRSNVHGQGSVLKFLAMLLIFVVSYFVFKMIFGYKRKLVIKRMLKTIPAYALVFALVTTVFSTGLFGYSSRIPNADEVAYIEFSIDIVNPNCIRDDYNGIHREALYGYANMKMVENASIALSNGIIDSVDGSLYEICQYKLYTVTDTAEIKKLIGIHKKFVEDGKIKDSASNACGINFHIIYNLDNGKSVTRYYTETTEATALEVFGLNELDCVKREINGISSTYYADDLIDYEYDSDVEEPVTDSKQAVYALAKDLKNAHYIGVSTDELEAALLKDLKNQSVADVFFHKAEDEIGALSFGISYTVDLYFDEATGEYYNDERLPDEDSLKIGDSFNANVSITSMDAQTFVITKDMTNTIKYLTDKDLMKYFKSDFSVNDIKSVKLATKAQSVDKSNSYMLPLFAAAYSNAIDNKKNDLDAKRYDFQSSHYFEHYVNNEITNKSTIQKILDNSFLYGYCGNDYRIAEVTYIDGSIATYCVTSEVYNSLMK